MNKCPALKADMAPTRDQPPKTALLYLPGWVAQTERPHKICEQKRKNLFCSTATACTHMSAERSHIFCFEALLHRATCPHTLRERTLKLRYLTEAVRLLRLVIWAPKSKARRPAAGVHAHTLLAHQQGGAGKRDVMRGLILPTWQPLAASCCSSFKPSCL